MAENSHGVGAGSDRGGGSGSGSSGSSTTITYSGRPSSDSGSSASTTATATGATNGSIPYRHTTVKWSDPTSGGDHTNSGKANHGNGGGGGGASARRRGQLDPRFQVRRNPARPLRGRGVFAVEPVMAGAVVLVAKQAAALPRGRYRTAFCRRCLTLLDKSQLIKCRRCEDRFCGKECVIAAAGEGTHEATCDFVEGLGGECLEKLGEGDNAAAAEKDILRLTVECLARRGAGLSDDEEWIEIDDLVLPEQEREAGGGGGGCDGGFVERDGMLEDDVVRDAQTRLNNRGLAVSAEEIQTVHRRLRRNFHTVQPEPLGRLLPPTVIGIFPAASLVNHSCEPNACFSSRRAGPGGQVLEYVLRCTADVAAGEEVCVSYLAHCADAVAKQGRRELLQKVWGFSCDCQRCEEDAKPAGSSSGDWRVTKMLESIEALLENAQNCSVREIQVGLRSQLEQGLQMLLAGPDISSRLRLQLATRIDEVASRRRMHGSLRFRSAQELADRLVSLGLDSGYTADLRFTQHREALRWAADARLDGGYRRGEQMMRASRDSLEEAIKVAVICLVAPVALRHVGVEGGGGRGAAVKHRATTWLLLLLFIAGSTGAEPNTDAGDVEPAGVEVHVSGGVEQALASSKENATTAFSLLESLLASLDPFLAEHGLPPASIVLGGAAVTVLFLLLLSQIGIGGGGGSGSSKKRKGVVLFLGPCGSGKTAVCYRLSQGGQSVSSTATAVSTVTSMEACRYPCSPGRSSSAATASLVDYPGHERLRGGVGLELRGADRIVFMLDGSCLAAQVAAGAELLYDVLADPSLEGCRGLMLALSKSDLKETKAARAKMLLQKELDKLRDTRGMLGTQGEEDDMPSALALGRPGQPFSLEVDSPCEFVVAGCSVVKEGGLDSVLDFVRASLQ
eukprot:g1899.t1